MKTRTTLLALLFYASAALSGLALPTIVTQPADQTAIAGSNATFCVVATGAPPLTYQWWDYTTGTLSNSIAGATNDCLVLTNVQPTSHRFRVVVSDSSGSVASRLATLTVLTPPTITQQPADATVELSQTYNNQVIASGTAPLAYQWYFVAGGVTNLLPGKTGSTLSIPNIQTNNAGGYLVTITNLYGPTTSRLAQLKVIDERLAFTRIPTGPGTNAPANYNGCEWVDYNNDGWPDLYAVSGYPSTSANWLYRNNGDGTFTPLTSGEAGGIVSDQGDWIMATWGDYDNDGSMDAYVTAWSSPNALYRNNRDGTFARINETEPRLTGPGNTAGAPWGDFDNDGLLDLFVASSFEAGVRSHLYRNTNGGFVKVPGPLSPGPASIEGSSWCDYDNDGDLDLIVADPANEGGQGLLVYRNDGAGNFTRVTAGALTDASGFILFPAFADYDNDGLMDVCVSRLKEPSLLFHNDGDGQFTPRSIRNLTSASCPVWGDYDNDGNLDLYLTGTTTIQPSQFLRNNGDGTFTELKNIAPVRDVNTRTSAGGWGDYDNDGFLDLIVGPDYSVRTNLFFFHNEGNSNHWLMVKLAGTVCNRAAIGAKVKAKAIIGGKTLWQLREMTRGSRTGDDLRAHFGLGDATKIDVVRVEWPSSRVTEWHNVAAGQILTLTEPTNDLPVIVTQPADQTNPIGSHATFCVVATGTPPLSYQWRDYTSAQNFADIPDATNACLTLTNIQPTTHRFAVVVSNPSGSVMSRLAKLTVLSPPIITQQPANATVEIGQTYTNQVVASSTASLSYQWFFNEQPLPGQTASTLTITNIQLTNAGDYSVVVTNLYGPTTSKVAKLRVFGPGVTFTKITSGLVVTDAVRNWSGMWGDYDGDGLFDLVVVGDVNPGTNTQFYHNEGNGEFTRLTNGPMFGATDALLYGVWADLENDGDLDFFAVPERNTLFVYRNQGGGQFTRETAPLNLAVQGASVSWGDYDGDGFLDAFLGSWTGIVPNGSSLLHNKGDGTFSVVTDQPMCVTTSGDETSSWVDYDNDGDLDLFAARSGGTVPTQIYRNDGNGQFVEATPEPLRSELGLRIGGAWADFDNDGDLDLFIPSSSVNNSIRFYVNQGQGSFVHWQGEPTFLTSEKFGLLAVWGDYDNDGQLDLYVGGSLRTGRLFRSVGNGDFVEITSVAPAKETGNRCPVWVDYDNDGDLDLFTAALDLRINRLYRNDGSPNHWLKVRLKGTKSNSHGVGARVFATATIGGKTSRQMRQITAQTVIQELEAHFGLGDSTNVETLRIEWPSGHVTEVPNVAANQILTIQEPPGVKFAGWEFGDALISVTGNIGERYDLWTSSDVAATNWIPWQTVTNTSRTMTLVDPLPGGAQRFYKATPAK